MTQSSKRNAAADDAGAQSETQPQMTQMTQISNGKRSRRSQTGSICVRTTIRMRHYSRRTESTYAHWIRRFIVFHDKKHPNTLGAREIMAFLSWLASSQHVSASTQNRC